MVKISFLVTVLFALSLQAYCQRGMLDNALGIRLGLGNGVTYQHFASNRIAIEGIAYQRYGAFNLTCLVEAHEKLFDVKGFRYFYGAGGHIWAYNQKSVLEENNLSENSIALGVDAIIGIAYYLRSFPIQLSVDWKPAMNLKGSNYIEWDSGGLSVRYRF
jgi:hypothetical protein